MWLHAPSRRRRPVLLRGVDACARQIGSRCESWFGMEYPYWADVPAERSMAKRRRQRGNSRATWVARRSGCCLESAGRSTAVGVRRAFYFFQISVLKCHIIASRITVSNS